DALVDRGELGDVPRPDLVGRGGGEGGLRMGLPGALIAALTRLPGLGEDAVHRADRGEIDAASEQGRVDLGRRLVGELGAMERVEDVRALGLVEAARARGAVADWPGLGPRTTPPVERGPAHVQGLTRGVDRDDLGPLFDHGHQLCSSRSGSAMPRIACAFFWRSITALATSSLCRSRSSSLCAARSCRSFASSLGLRPGLRASRPWAPFARSCLRHVARCELYTPSSRSSAPTAPGSPLASAASAAFTILSFSEAVNRRRVFA